MKHGSRQSQQARSAAKGEGAPQEDRKGQPAQGSKRQYAPTTPVARYVNAHPSAGLVKLGESYPLLANLESEAELGERLKQHGCDIYAGGPYATYADRLGAAIVREGMQGVIVGRGPDGKPEAYAQAYRRLCGKALPA